MLDIPIPEQIEESLILYRDKHIRTGGFLEAVLANDLMEAFGRADIYNRMEMFNICSYVYNNMPYNCHGSYEIVKAWLDKGKSDEDTI